MKKSVKILLLIPVFIIIFILSTLAFFTITAYNPDEKVLLEPLSLPDIPGIAGPGDLSITIWNTGYSGLDENTDFFMEGGKMARPAGRTAVDSALAEITSFLADRESDIYLIQEVDQDSARTWRIDQVSVFSRNFPDYYPIFARNFKSLFVPVPPAKPIGRVDSGIMTLTRYEPTESIRYQLPGSYRWPVKIFHLKRCALLTRIPSADTGKDWCLFNIHLSAYDDGSLRLQQLDYLKNLAEELYEEGHYVVIGGDWNSIIPGIKRDSFRPYTTDEENLEWLKDFPEKWAMEEWQWCFDPQVSTIRSLEQPYRRGENFETIIDGFYISPNLEIREVRGWDLAFRHSDHNPVSVTLRTKN